MKTTGSPKGAADHGINGSRIQKKSPKGLKRPKTAEDVHILDASKEGNVGRFINVRGREHRQKLLFLCYQCLEMNSGLLEDVCNFLIVSLTYSTAATQTSFFRTSSQTPMTLPSPSSPSSPTGEEEEDDACCVAVTQPVLFLKVVFFSVSPSVVKAGTELTWKYSDDTKWKQEVPCLCSSDACQGHFVIAENLCDV